MTFSGFLIFWPPKIPTATPFGGDGIFFIDFLDSSWNLPDFWNFDPRGGMGKKQILLIFWTVQDISRSFDPLKFPLRPPLVGGGEILLSIFSTFHEIYRTF